MVNIVAILSKLLRHDRPAMKKLLHSGRTSVLICNARHTSTTPPKRRPKNGWTCEKALEQREQHSEREIDDWIVVIGGLRAGRTFTNAGSCYRL